MSRDIPIIYSAPMILALLDGRKTMTRRLAWRPIHPERPVPKRAVTRVIGHEVRGVVASSWQGVKPGDRLWVREACRLNVDYHTPAYREDYPEGSEPPVPDAAYRWRPSIHMPRAWSRLTLIVTAVKVERLQEISEAEAKAEGCAPGLERTKKVHGWTPYVLGFSLLWDTLHGTRAWDSNPEVVALTFTVHKQNIDTLKEAA